MNYIENRPDKALLLRLYEKMLLLRNFELAAQIACKAGETPGFLHLYVGQEATAVGVCENLEQKDWVTSTHRGHGHALAKGSDPKAVMAELFGKSTGICGGRGGTMHLYDKSTGLFGTNGIVGAGIGHAAGIGIGSRLMGDTAIGVSFFGDGAINHGAFHEAINFAAIQKAPAIFICENNLYATATPLNTTTLNYEVATKADSYGIPGISVDGNDVYAVWRVVKEATDRARSGKGPTLIEAKTYRQVAHHEGDTVLGSYRTQKEYDRWKKRDPIDLLKNKMVDELGVVKNKEIESIRAKVETIVEEAIAFARTSPEPNVSTLDSHVYANPINPSVALRTTESEERQEQGWLEAVRDGIAEEMRKNDSIQYFGEGTGERGGTFAHTKNLWQEFGAHRMVDTPISEQGFTAAAIGASAIGARTIADLMFADFTFEAAGQIFLQAAKLRYMSCGGMQAPVIIRVGAGAIRSAGPHHSGLYHPVFAHMPGLIVCLPSNPSDAKGLMKTALRASDPVIMLEPKSLFASKGFVPVKEHFVPFGLANVTRQGTDITVVAMGSLVIESLKAAEILEKEGISVEIIDPRTIMPLDVETIVQSVKKTNHLLVVDESWAMCGLGGEIAQSINELAFDELDAPPGRLHSAATSHPFAPNLEYEMLVNKEKIIAAIKNVLTGVPTSQAHWRALSERNLLKNSSAPNSLHKGSNVLKSNSETAEKSQKSSDDPPLNPEIEDREKGSKDDVPILMPFGDLTVSEGKVVSWHYAIGDLVKAGDTIAEVETDKAVLEIDSPETGTLIRIDIKVGEVVQMGARIGGLKK